MFSSVQLQWKKNRNSTVKTRTLSLSQDQITTRAKAVYSFQPMTGTGNFDLLNCSRVVSAIGIL